LVLQNKKGQWVSLVFFLYEEWTMLMVHSSFLLHLTFFPFFLLLIFLFPFSLFPFFFFPFSFFGELDIQGIGSWCEKNDIFFCAIMKGKEGKIIFFVV